MLFNSEDAILEQFAQMKTAYSALLNSPGLDDRSTGSSLEVPLSQLFYNSYLDLHPREEWARVDVVKFLGGNFLLDSQGYDNPEVSSRIVGAFGISQETSTLKELLARLRREWHAGDSMDKTLGAIRNLLWVTEDTASPARRQALYKGMFLTLRIHEQGLAQVFEAIAARSKYLSALSRRSARYLRELSSRICDGLRAEGLVTEVPFPREGQPLPADFWDRLRELVRSAERNLAEDRKLPLTVMLGNFYSQSAGELVSSLRNPTDELAALVEQHVCPVVDISRGWPRNSRAQKRMRFKNTTKHLYDIGHFLPHSAGGPKDINFFVQERRLNRGWSVQGKRYRWLENVVFSHPGTFFFVRPVYGDLSPIPRYLEWGALLDESLIAELVDDLERMPDLHLVSPEPDERSRPKLSWLISVFENFKAQEINDLMVFAVGEI